MEHTVNKGLTEPMQTIASEIAKNQESTTYGELGQREDYPQFKPTVLAGYTLTWSDLVRGFCRLGIIHEECGCPLADHGSVKPVENPEPATDPESATDVTPQPVDSTGK